MVQTCAKPEPPQKMAQAPAKMYCSYTSIHTHIQGSLAQLQAAGWGAPDLLIAISGGGLIPARILRSTLRTASSKGCASIQVIGLELYDDELDGKPRETGVIRTQWLQDAGAQLLGKKILVVDEVDDSRTTLAYAVRELQADIAAAAAAAQAAGHTVPPTKLATYVIHDKQRPKVGVLPDHVPRFVAQRLAGDPWIVYPWDAVDIVEHERLASLASSSSAASLETVAGEDAGTAALASSSSGESEDDGEAAGAVGHGGSACNLHTVRTPDGLDDRLLACCHAAEASR